MTARSAMSAALALGLAGGGAAAAPRGLAGVHWWGYTSPFDPNPTDATPHDLLDTANQGGWNVETIVTESDPWWRADWFAPHFAHLGARDVNTITRLDYNWGRTIPAPNEPAYATWKNAVVQTVDTLRAGSHLWQIGNEPNIVGEGQNWPASQVTPAGYAALYRDVRQAVHARAQASPLGSHRVLVAPPSPGGVIPGVRWKDGTAWLAETLAQIPAGEVDGVALHSYGGGVGEFRRGLMEQIAAIDAAGLRHVPLFITEFNRFSQPGNAAQESAAADFVRGAYAMLDEWNRVRGNHNLVSASWFVYDANNQAGGGWDGFAIEYWKDHGNPAGHAGDLFTAFRETARRGYSAGAWGTPDLPEAFRILDNFDENEGRFTQTPGFSANSAGLDRSRSTADRTTDEGFSGIGSQRLAIVDRADQSGGWRVRHLSASGLPPSNAQIPLSDGSDGFIGLAIKTMTPGLRVQLALDSNGSSAFADTKTTRELPIIADGTWRLYEWNLDAPSDFVPSALFGSDGVLPAGGFATLDSVLLYGGDVTAVLWIDLIAHNPRGSLRAIYIPEPHAAATWGLLALAAATRARR